MENTLAFIVTEHENGWLDISWPSNCADGGMGTLSYRNPSEVKRALLHEAMLNEDFKTLCDIWDEEN